MKRIMNLMTFLVVFLMVTSVVAAAPKLGKITFIHYKKAPAKPGNLCGNGICEPGENANKCPADCGGSQTSTCYAFISKGFKWRGQEAYVVNPLNGDGLSADFIMSAVNAGVAEWETYGGNIFGAGSLDNGATFDEDADGSNEIVFGSWPDPNVIGVTRIWGVWWGKPDQRYIAEYDLLLNDYYVWGDSTLNSTVMDLQNIATHELGHGAGMNDLYDTACVDETMYGYSTEGEIKKRDLNNGDIIGIQNLYS